MCPNTLCTLIGCSLRLLKLDNTRKNRRKDFVTLKLAVFLNVCFYQPLRTQGIDLINCTQIVKKPLWTLIICTLRFFIPDSMRKKMPPFYSHLKDSLCSKKLYFQQPLRCYRNDLINRTKIAKIPCGA